MKAVRGGSALRDVLILQSGLEERIGELAFVTSTETPETLFAGASAMVLAHVLNSSPPERLRKSNAILSHDLMRHGRLTKRELLKETHRARGRDKSPKTKRVDVPA